VSKTLINYDLVVQELSKGLEPLDGEMALTVNYIRYLAISEFRTLRYGSGRQKGATSHIVDLIGKHEGPVLFLTHVTPLRDEYMRRHQLAYPDNNNVTSLCGYFPENWQADKFSLVVIDDAGFFFNKFSYGKIFRSLADAVTDDVVIHLIN